MRLAPPALLASLAALTVVACGGGPTPATPVAQAAATSSSTTSPPPTATSAPVAPELASHPVALPGASGIVLLDHMAVDRAAGRAWVPAAGLGNVVLVDGASASATHADGFTTAEVDVHGHKYMVGPSAAALGGGVVFVGNRGDGTICAVDPSAMKAGACYSLGHGAELTESAGGLSWVAAANELWVTIGAPAMSVAPPPDGSIVVLDASNPQKLSKKGKIKLGGTAVGYAVDDARGVFYTNVVEANETLAIDVKSKAVTSRWKPGCDNEGPRGLAVDAGRGFLFVACSSGVVVLDAGHDGAVLSKVDSGPDAFDIDYEPAKKQLFVAAGEHGKLTVYAVDDHGATTELASAKTAKGARAVVADDAGRSYVADPANGRVLVFDPVPGR